MGRGGVGVGCYGPSAGRVCGGPSQFLFLRCFFFFSSRRRHTRFKCDWSSDVCSSDLNYVCASGSPGVVPSQFLFGLTVPRHFVAPNTQQWNLTLQRALGKQWVLEVGYVGTHAVHLRETRTSIQARLASPSNPIVLTDTRGNT